MWNTIQHYVYCNKFYCSCIYKEGMAEARQSHEPGGAGGDPGGNAGPGTLPPPPRFFMRGDTHSMRASAKFWLKPLPVRERGAGPHPHAGKTGLPPLRHATSDPHYHHTTTKEASRGRNVWKAC